MLNNIQGLLAEKFAAHPFSRVPEGADYEKLLANYLAMSQAFPYLQAGSQGDIFNHYIQQGSDIPEHVELTTVVGNFLCWDETGGLMPTVTRGLKALPKILETKRFHANLLKKDCEKLFSKAITPDYSPITREYLSDLYLSLSSVDAIKRVASMVSFEAHANQMITSLWKTISEKFSFSPKSLTYFVMHVGGDDPAEAYHVEMTQKLIDKIVDKENEGIFISHFEKFYARHMKWCHDISTLS